MGSTLHRTVATTAAVSAALLLAGCKSITTSGPDDGTAPPTSSATPASTAQAAHVTASPTGHTVVTATASPTRTAQTPVLGAVWATHPQLKGYGQIKPVTIFNGGDPTGLVDGITWASWGGAKATATGQAEYVAPDQSIAQGTQDTATVVAFDLGTCNGRPAYRAVEWYFPDHGQQFDPTRYIDACTGENHGM